MTILHSFRVLLKNGESLFVYKEYMVEQSVEPLKPRYLYLVWHLILYYLYTISICIQILLISNRYRKEAENNSNEYIIITIQIDHI